MMFIIFLLITLVVFLMIREGVCWYFKINERLGALLEIKSSLDILVARGTTPTSNVAARHDDGVVGVEDDDE